MVKWRNTPEDQLAHLSQLLESGDAIPPELATVTAAYIQEAIENDGKLPLGRKPGRPSASAKKYERACDVAKLVIVDKIKRTEAIDIVATRYEVKPSTVEQNYKRYGKTAREIIRFWAQAPEWSQLHEELKRLLLTFSDNDGSSMTVKQVQEIAGSIPVLDLKRIVDTISGGQLKRDSEYLNEVLALEKSG